MEEFSVQISTDDRVDIRQNTSIITIADDDSEKLLFLLNTNFNNITQLFTL